MALLAKNKDVKSLCSWLYYASQLSKDKIVWIIQTNHKEPFRAFDTKPPVDVPVLFHREIKWLFYDSVNPVK